MLYMRAAFDPSSASVAPIARTGVSNVMSSRTSLDVGNDGRNIGALSFTSISVTNNCKERAGD